MPLQPIAQIEAPSSVALSFSEQPAPADATTDAAAPALAAAPRAVPAPALPDNPPEVDKRISILLLGVDQRPDDPSPSRTDNIIVLTVDPKSGETGMLSLPRDLFVPIPGFKYSGKINTAYVVGEINKYPGGGGALAKKTVSELLGYPIDYYVKINFDGFEKVVDLVGGVDVVVPKTIHDTEYPTIDYGYQTFHIEKGPQHLDGETALKYVRTRHADNDFERSKRQQQVLLAIKDKIVENKLLTTLHVLDFLAVLSNSVEHDVPLTAVPGLVGLASRVQFNDINQFVLDERYAQINANSPYGWILVPDRNKMRPAMDAIFNPKQQVAAKPLTPMLTDQETQQQTGASRQQAQDEYQAQADGLRRQLAAEGAKIAVTNGTSNPVLAARAADWLERQGYQIVEYGQADRNDYPRTVLVTKGGKPFTVSSLRDTFAIADANVKVSNDVKDKADLRLIIGQDFYLLVSN